MKLFKGCADGNHRFEARYDKGPSQCDFEGRLTDHRLSLIEKYRHITYVRDVCVRCGKTIERQKRFQN